MTLRRSTWKRGSKDGKLEDGAAVLTTEANRVREFGFGAAEIDRAKAWMKAFYEHAYTDREKTESGSFAQEYVSYFLNDEPSPGIEYQYKLVQQLLPTITDADTSNLARALLKDDSRVILATMPQKSGVKIPTAEELQAAIAAASATRVTPWTETGTTRALMENPPSGGSVASRRTLDDIGVTIVRFANGVEAWLKPTDFKNDQILFTLNAMGGASLASPEAFLDASMATALVSESGVGGLKATDLQKVLDRQAGGGAAVHRVVVARCLGKRPAGAARNGAAAALPGRHRAGQRSRSVRADEEAARSGGCEPWSRTGADLRREAVAGEHVQPLHGAAAHSGAGRVARS